MSAAEPAEQSPWKFELWFALGGLVFGLLILPALIYLVGTLMLGPYAEENGLMSMYGNLFSDLAKGEVRAWLLVVGPYIVVATIRGIWRFGSNPNAPEGPEPTGRSKAEHGEKRVEPKISWD
jgi:hypothetical protein